MQRVSVESGRMWQRLFVMRRCIHMTGLSLIGRLLGDAVRCASSLQSSTPCDLNFDSGVGFGVDLCGDLSIDLVLVWGA